jgi:hypothetical protein
MIAGNSTTGSLAESRMWSLRSQVPKNGCHLKTLTYNGHTVHLKGHSHGHYVHRVFLIAP